MSKKVREPTGVEEWERRSGSESEGSESESERSGWVIMQHLVQTGQKKKRRDGDTNKNSSPDRSTSGSASINSGVLYPTTSRNTHAPWCVVGRLFSLPWRIRLAVLHHWAACNQPTRIRQKTRNPSATLQRHIWSSAGHQTISSFNVSESLMWSGNFLNQIQLCDRNYTAMCN